MGCSVGVLVSGTLPLAILGNTGGGTKRLRISYSGSRERSSLTGGLGRCFRSGRASGVECRGVLRLGSSSNI